MPELRWLWGLQQGQRPFCQVVSALPRHVGNPNTYDSVGSPVAGGFASLVTMGLRSVPFLLFLPPLPLAAEAATLAICLPLFSMALVRSTPSMFVAWKVLGGNHS